MQKILTYYRLGLRNILRITAYRLLCKSGYYARIQPIRSSYTGPFWEWPPQFQKVQNNSNEYWTLLAERILGGELLFYSHSWRKTGFPPVKKNENEIHWTKIQEFSLNEGDIKNLWEPSRFHGMLTMGLGYLSSGDARFSQGIEEWISTWVQENPANSGAQWKCGQETGIRLMHILLMSEILRDHSNTLPTSALERFVTEHCQRIAPTMLYAIAQDNNHGTSEAAALYMAGIWLKKYFPNNSHAQQWQKIGRYWLENRIQHLIMPDGSFSQHSINYHRLMLDTISITEYWRARFNDQKFSSEWYEKALSATHWLESFIDPLTGNIPNLGANDGARIFVLYQDSYRDYRPSVQLASILFENIQVYDKEKFNESLFWLKHHNTSSLKKETRSTKIFSDGGYARIIANEKMWGVLRLPTYYFRPNHSDALHFDLWRNGINWLRDGGTYSYNTDEKWLKYFPGTASHSTVQFDNRDQMPRLGRFLFGTWLNCREFIFNKKNPAVVKASYADYLGATHSRTITFDTDKSCIIKDEIAGFTKSATLRFRLPRMKWEQKEKCVSSDCCLIEVQCDKVITRSEIVTGHESLFYEELEELPVFECEVQSSPAVFTTIIHFQDHS